MSFVINLSFSSRLDIQTTVFNIYTDAVFSVDHNQTLFCVCSLPDHFRSSCSDLLLVGICEIINAFFRSMSIFTLCSLKRTIIYPTINIGINVNIVWL